MCRFWAQGYVAPFPLRLTSSRKTDVTGAVCWTLSFVCGKLCFVKTTFWKLAVLSYSSDQLSLVTTVRMNPGTFPVLEQ
jgi:hypothetical protein